ncbi:MAG: hypothetical protein CM15mP59_3670 [Flavobacteriaceae bacterium]|nr:MAG: hypothetical protein CM15mP59_3670 [Flavobacteriaceae bacterium]
MYDETQCSCTTLPLSRSEWGNIHPFAPKNQVQGYQHILQDLEGYLSEITGFSGTSLQPNSGAQGEFSGLMVIRSYHESRGDSHRNICLIPSSAHGTNPASAVMAGMRVVVVGTINMATSMRMSCVKRQSSMLKI